MERIDNKFSIHKEYKPEMCPNFYHAQWRVLECHYSEGYDVVECSRCGMQVTQGCNFDEEYD